MELAANETVGLVVGGLVALLAAFFGLNGGVPALPAAPPARTGAFCVAATVAVLAGVTLRALNTYAPDPESMAREWKRAGFDATAAAELVAFERLGIVQGAWSTPTGTLESSQERIARRTTALYASLRRTHAKR